MISIVTRVSLLFVLLFSFATQPTAQTASSAEAAKGTGSISGRVTLGDKAMPGIAVLVLPGDNSPDGSARARAVTDGDGQYRLTGLAAGHFRVTTAAAAYVVTSESGRPWETGKIITLGDGEAVEGIDFSLMRGGVITGRVTGPGGRLLIAERVELSKVDDKGKRQQFYSPNYYMYQTDDRGVYRLYGLPECRYLLSAGRDESRSQGVSGTGNRLYKLTFYPDTNEEAQAAIIEVSAGKEATGIDIKLGKSVQAYSASGRVIDAESGKPVPGVYLGFGAVENKRFMGMMGGLQPSNDQGEFNVEGLMPGSYAVFTQPITNPTSLQAAANDYYNEPVPFEIIGEKVTGLEIKLQRGGSISGVAVIEGTNDPAVLTKLPQLQIRASIQRRNAGQNNSGGGASSLEVPFSFSSPVAANGSFNLSGLRPGTAYLYLGTWQGPLPKGFSIMRIEREGAAQQSFEIGLGRSRACVS